MERIKTIAIIILAIATLFFGYQAYTKKTETIKVPVTVEIPIPAIKNVLPPVKFPTPKKEKPRPKLVEDFQKADSIVKDSLYKDAITERTYEETFKDSVQEVTVKSKVQGKLLKQEVKYHIFPRTVKKDTTLSIDIPKRLEVLGEVELGTSIDNPLQPLIKAGIHVRPTKKLGFKASYDTDKRVWIGTSIKLW